jgi:hypothetical protein
MESEICLFPENNIAMFRNISEEEEKEEEVLETVPSTQGQKGRCGKAIEVMIDPWSWPFYDAKPREHVDLVTVRSVLVNYEVLASGSTEDQINDLVYRALLEVSFNFEQINLLARNPLQNS